MLMFLPFMERTGSGHGRHGICLVKLATPLRSWVSNGDENIEVLKGLLSSCTTGAMLLTNVDSFSLDLLALKQRTYESISPTHTPLKELISVVQNCIVIHPEHDLCTLPTHQGTCEESAQNPAWGVRNWLMPQYATLDHDLYTLWTGFIRIGPIL